MLKLGTEILKELASSENLHVDRDFDIILNILCEEGKHFNFLLRVLALMKVVVGEVFVCLVADFLWDLLDFHVVV